MRAEGSSPLVRVFPLPTFGEGVHTASMSHDFSLVGTCRGTETFIAPTVFSPVSREGLLENSLPFSGDESIPIATTAHVVLAATLGLPTITRPLSLLDSGVSTEVLTAPAARFPVTREGLPEKYLLSNLDESTSSLESIVMSTSVGPITIARLLLLQDSNG